jgi:hypothetical protein
MRMARVDGGAMKPWIWLRIAAALQAFGVVGHNLETLSTKPTHGPAEQAVFDAMRAFRFDLMGATRSTWDFYRGYQFSTTVTFVLLVTLLWMLSGMSRRAPEEAKPLVVALLIAQVFNVIIGFEFFFAAPGVVGALIGLCLGIAALGLYRVDKAMLTNRQRVSA